MKTFNRQLSTFSLSYSRRGFQIFNCCAYLHIDKERSMFRILLCIFSLAQDCLQKLEKYLVCSQYPCLANALPILCVSSHLHINACLSETKSAKNRCYTVVPWRIVFCIGRHFQISQFLSRRQMYLIRITVAQHSPHEYISKYTIQSRGITVFIERKQQQADERSDILKSTNVFLCYSPLHTSRWCYVSCLPICMQHIVDIILSFDLLLRLLLHPFQIPALLR